MRRILKQDPALTVNPEARLPALGRVVLRGEEERRAAGCERGRVVRAGMVAAGEGAATVVEGCSLSKVMEDRTEEMIRWASSSPSSTSFSTRLLGRSKDGPGWGRVFITSLESKRVLFSGFFFLRIKEILLAYLAS